jgi:hypothetical protein
MARTRGSFSKARPNRDARQRAWASMRYLRVFTGPQIEMVSDINYDNLKKYLRALELAGYLQRRRAKRNGSPAGHVDWVLVRNTGPLHPIVRRDRSGVYDPNTDEVHPLCSVAAEVAVDSSDERRGRLARRLAAGL